MQGKGESLRVGLDIGCLITRVWRVSIRDNVITRQLIGLIMRQEYTIDHPLTNE